MDWLSQIQAEYPPDSESLNPCCNGLAFAEGVLMQLI